MSKPLSRAVALGAAFVIAACSGFARSRESMLDLAITNASVLDVRAGLVAENQDVLIRNGTIIAVVPSGQRPHIARQSIDARGRLLTPGFIDAHSHLCSVFCPAGSDSLPLEQMNARFADYRSEFGNAYLPFGVTAVRDAGSDERALDVLMQFAGRSPESPDFYPSGAQLISPQRNRYRAEWQTVVADSAAAVAKVREYERAGIRHLKLYWRLREPEFTAALKEAQRLGMIVTGHVDQGVMRIDRALSLGLKNIEHIHPFGYSLLNETDFRALVAASPPPYPPTALFLNVAEIFNYLGPKNPRMQALLEDVRANGATVTPTLHVFAQRYGLTYFASTPRDSTEDTSVWTQQQRDRAIAGYRIMASYVKELHDMGVRLNIGTDSSDPGKAVLSEMLLLHDAGIPMHDVFRIATLDTAGGIGIDGTHGSIEAGKRANVILFDGDPLSRSGDLLGSKTVFKDGIRVSP